MRNFRGSLGGAGSGRAAWETPARRAPRPAARADKSQAEMLRELGWTLAGCALVIVAVNLVGIIVAHH